MSDGRRRRRADRSSFATEETYLRTPTIGAREQARSFLTFAAGSEIYGVEILRVREIIKRREITEVPRAPRFLLGVVSVRGAVHPGGRSAPAPRLRPGAAHPRTARILVVMHDGERFGLLVDDVRGLVRCARPISSRAPSSSADRAPAPSATSTPSAAPWSSRSAS